jgi:hypothetical protein
LVSSWLSFPMGMFFFLLFSSLGSICKNVSCIGYAFWKGVSVLYFFVKTKANSGVTK